MAEQRSIDQGGGLADLPASDDDICPDCHGTGRFDGDRCALCAGRGSIIAERSALAPSGRQEGRVAAEPPAQRHGVLDASPVRHAEAD